MTRTACYIDGFNLYHAIEALEKPHLKWLNLHGLATSFLRRGDHLEQVVYFTAIMVWNQEKSRRHREYISALRAVGVEVILSKFQSSGKHCIRFDRYCSFREEKQTDVAFSSRILCDCLRDSVDRVVIVTADSDQVPTVAAIRGLIPKVQVSLACPPGRLRIARELGDVAHDFREISPGRLEQFLLPRNVRDARGRVAARCPALYNHPDPTS